MTERLTLSLEIPIGCVGDTKSGIQGQRLEWPTCEGD